MTWLALGGFASVAVTLALFAGGCDTAWDGPSFLEQGYASADVFVGGDDVGALPDIVREPDIVAMTDLGADPDLLPGEDLPAPDAGVDIPGGDDIQEPDIPQILGCEPPEGPLNLMTEIHLSDEATPGWGIDLDGNPETCYPVKLGCEHGIDNSMAAVAPMLEPMLQDLFKKADGPLFAMQHLTTAPQAAPYEIAGWTVQAAEGKQCRSTETCTVSLHSQTEDGTCEPAWRFDNALVLDDDVLVAGRYDSKHTFRLSVLGDGNYREIDLYALQIRALVTVEGDEVVGMSGVLGGAIRFSDLLVLIGLVPDDFFDLEEFGSDELIDYLTFLEFVSGTPLTDYFLPDGTGEAISFALTFEAFAAPATGGSVAELSFDLVP